MSVELRFVTASEFASVDEPGSEPLVGDDGNVLIPEGGDVMFYGDGGAGKTTLMIDLGLHLAAGDDWLGIPVGRAVRVAIVENEGPRPLFRAKLRRKLHAWGGSSFDDRLLLLEDPWSRVSLDNPKVREALAAEIADLELDALLVGPVTRSGMNEAGTLQQVRDYANLLAEIRAASGRRVTFLLAHHENRGGQSQALGRARPTRSFTSRPRGTGRPGSTSRRPAGRKSITSRSCNSLGRMVRGSKCARVRSGTTTRSRTRSFATSSSMAVVAGTR